METRYCIEYVNPRHPLCDNGSLNVRYDRVLTLEQAEHDLTLILSFGGKILDLYMGNVVDGETGKWSPKPMIIDDDDWFSTKWLNTLEVKEADLVGKLNGFQNFYAHENGGEFPSAIEIAKHFYELGVNTQKEQFEKNRLKHCNSITNEQAELEQGFIDQHLDKHQRMPTFLDAIEYGMRLQKEQMMEKAVKAVIHPYDGEIWVDKDLLSIYDDCQRVKLIIIEEE